MHGKKGESVRRGNRIAQRMAELLEIERLWREACFARHSSLSNPGRCGDAFGVERLLGYLERCHGVVLLAAASRLGQNQ